MLNCTHDVNQQKHDRWELATLFVGLVVLLFAVVVYNVTTEVRRTQTSVEEVRQLERIAQALEAMNRECRQK
jgi:Tfp pilus assembly protein PilW